MPEVLLPREMPAGLVTRDPDRGGSVQVARPARATAEARVEDAIAHLAAVRMVPVPASSRLVPVDTGGVTVDIRYAEPILPRRAKLWGILTSDQPVNVDLSATTSYEATAVTETVEIGPDSATENDWLGVEFTLLVELGDGTPSAHDGAYGEVSLELTSDVADATVLLIGHGIDPLPLVPPWGTGTVTV